MTVGSAYYAPHDVVSTSGTYRLSTVFRILGYGRISSSTPETAQGYCSNLCTSRWQSVFSGIACTVAHLSVALRVELQSTTCQGATHEHEL